MAATVPTQRDVRFVSRGKRASERGQGAGLLGARVYQRVWNGPGRGLGVLVLAMGALGADRTPAQRRALEDAGQVRYIAYDMAREQPAFPGRTDFDLRVTWNCRYERVRTIRREGRRILVVRPVFDRVDVTVTHQVRLPRVENPDEADTVLLDHELDHVAISADPRLFRLLEGLVRGIDRLEVELRGDEPALKEQLDAGLSAAARARTDSVTAVVRRHYEALDARTRHGLLPLEDRAAFFERLYTAEGLTEAGLPGVAAAGSR